MFHKIENTKNGYIFDIDDTTTNEQWKDIYKQYNKVKCVICNKKTASCFRPTLFGNNIVTINNKLPDAVVYINSIY